ncbi:molybdopterin guanine dinucleotide biosynthesis accessory protein MobB [Oscillibacter sp. PC13]|uniref:molybdopterin-guanine dinucleotide biosynthesis protein B n=1 Tax=Oscillibacter sp. PC13 TaxID=1855299 RepID=UPI0008EF3282|nr:molybdopterin-guanine dinucleotide biosynthesis protein B [Oscillibacter sp. PC13]SFP08737.1 molybdopterin guanine dinucleotide biosynthesis accessory protein MobB [Oscillibacter sp. PC13]
MTAPIISFIGWSGVGKTTFLERLIPALKARGIRLALLKQDGHEFDMDKEGKDSWRFTQSGADVVTIANQAHAAVLLNRPTDFSEILAHVRDVDLILTEGYHNLHYPQIEIHRKGFETLRCLYPDQLIALVTDEPLAADAPQFGFEDLEPVCRLLLDQLPASPC